MSDHNKKGQFTKGNSAGSRSKRDKEIVSYIREKTNNLQDLVDMAYDMLYADTTTKKDKIALINMLLDRSMGKPSQAIHQTGDVAPIPVTFILDNTKKDDDAS